MIDRLRELLRAASKGPWFVLDDGYLSTDPDRWADDALLAWDHDGLGQSWRNKADAALIVELRNHAAELLDAHDRMAGALETILDTWKAPDDAAFRWLHKIVTGEESCEAAALAALEVSK